MPVEIHELVVKATINDEKHRQSGQNSGAASSSSGIKNAGQDDLNRVAELVSAILKRQKER